MKTLKEKFNIISCNDCDMPYCDIKCTTLSFMELDTLEQIAEQFAIDFLHWYLNNDDVKKFSYSYEDLLKDFKKEKGL